MNNGQNRRSFIEKMMIAFINFITMSALIFGLGLSSGNVFENPSVKNVVIYIITIVAALVFLILFLANWEDLFDNGHND